MGTPSVSVNLTEAELKLLQTLIYQECGMYFDERRAHFLQRCRAHIGAEAVAEIDQQEAAAEIGIGARLAGLVDQRERPADLYRAGLNCAAQSADLIACMPQQPRHNGSDYREIGNKSLRRADHGRGFIVAAD